MKVLAIHNRYQQPGGEDVVFEQEHQLLVQYGHEVITYQRSNMEIEKLSAYERLTFVNRMISAPDSKRDLLELLHEHKPDLAHVYNAFMMISPSAYEACREAGVPVLQTVQNYRLFCPAAFLYRDGKVCEECPEHGLQRSVWHRCYRDSHLSTAAVALMLRTHRKRRTWTDAITAYVVATEFAREKLVENGLPASKIYVKPNFVSPDPTERSTPGEYALFAGRLSEEKGVSTLLAAWSQLSKSIPLMIVGDGPMRQMLEAGAAHSKLSQVIFRGRLNATETRVAMKRAAFLIVPSLWYEGFPMVMVESLACGTPILASRLGAMREIVTDGRTGLHFTPGDSTDLAAKIEWAWNHPSELAAMGRQARSDYEMHYTAARNYAKTMEIYQAVLDKSVRN